MGVKLLNGFSAVGCLYDLQAQLLQHLAQLHADEGGIIGDEHLRHLVTLHRNPCSSANSKGDLMHLAIPAPHGHDAIGDAEANDPTVTTPDELGDDVGGGSQ